MNLYFSICLWLTSFWRILCLKYWSFNWVRFIPELISYSSHSKEEVHYFIKFIALFNLYSSLLWYLKESSRRVGVVAVTCDRIIRSVSDSHMIELQAPVRGLHIKFQIRLFKKNVNLHKSDKGKGGGSEKKKKIRGRVHRSDLYAIIRVKGRTRYR